MGTKMAVAFANIFMAKKEKEILRQSSIKPIFWKGLSMTSYQYGTVASSSVLLIFQRQTTSILQSNSRQKYQKQKLHFWTRKCTVVSDSTRILSLRCKHTSSLQENSNTQISIRVTHQASQKASSMEISLRLLRTNSSELSFEENMRNFFQHAERIEITQLQL